MATTSKTLLTAEEFLDRYAGQGAFELVNGEVIEVSPGMPEHGRVCANVSFVLESYGRQSSTGYTLSNDTAVLIKRDPDTVRGADVAFYSEARWPRRQAGSRLAPVVPDLVVEVFSPGDRPAAIREKVNEYLTAGVPLVWMVYPARREVAVYRPEDPIPTILHENDSLAELPELPGFRCLVADFFL